ncbi:MAG: S8 family serine peptidase [Woeseiaceae bacterium]|nr:S8 family serine peptidase [Woeseiaceae bacterium]
MRKLQSLLVALAVLPLGVTGAQELQQAPTVPDGLLQLDVGSVEQSRTRTYVVQLRQEPGLSYAGDLDGFAATAPASGERYNANASHVQVYTSHLMATHDSMLANVGAGSDAKIYSYCHTMNGFAATLTEAQAAQLRNKKGVAAVFEDFSVDIETNNSPEFLGLDDFYEGVHRRLKIKGEDVIVGVLDTGAIQEHPSFADTRVVDYPEFCDNPKKAHEKRKCRELAEWEEEGNFGPPPAHWNGICQAGEAWSEDDCNNKLVGARWYVDGFLAGRGSVVENEFLSPRDSSGHGSHTAGTAAGNEVEASLEGVPLARIKGMAPRARVSVYKVCWLSPGATNFSCFFSDSAAATDAAIADGVDVLNFSVGTAASFTDTQDLAFLRASTAGVYVARSGGNSGPGPGTTPAGEPWVTTVAASTHSGIAFSLGITVNSPESVAGDYTALEGAITQPLAISGAITDDLVAADPIEACAPLTNSIGGQIALIARGSCAFVTKVENAVAAGASAVLMYTDGRPKTIMGGTATPITQSIPGVMVDNDVGLALLAEVATPVNVTLAPGNYVEEPIQGNIMAGFSSRGPYLTETDWIKPDITAPGVRILAASTPEPADGSVGDLFAYLQGTSMSGPHIAGLGALLVEAHPDWSPAQIKSALMTTARQDVVKEDGVTPADPFDFGAGHVDINKAINIGLTYDAGEMDYEAASCGTVTPLVSAETCAMYRDELGLSLDPADLNLPSIGIGELPGTKTIKRTVTAVRGEIPRFDRLKKSTWNAVVEAPPGYSVEVSPSSITLWPGQSASYEVTITSVSAPPGEWFFGSLTWVEDRPRFAREVRSPIAVNSVAIVAPPEVSGEGPDGSGEFDITFGYTGDYTAQVHGLNDAALTLVPTEDDPFDEFVFLGPGVEIAFLAEVPPGTAFARWELTDEYTTGNDDIDLYLYYCPNFSCTQIGSSTNVNSNEQVEVLLPANDPAIDDPYLVFTHGFNVEGGTGELILFDYAFGLVDDAGNLTISGPASATIGATETISLEWMNLNFGIGFKQLGAVSHSDASGIQGLTIISIDNDLGTGICEFIACP